MVKYPIIFKFIGRYYDVIIYFTSGGFPNPWQIMQVDWLTNSQGFSLVLWMFCLFFFSPLACPWAWSHTASYRHHCAHVHEWVHDSAALLPLCMCLPVWLLALVRSLQSAGKGSATATFFFFFLHSRIINEVIWGGGLNGVHISASAMCAYMDVSFTAILGVIRVNIMSSDW